MENLAPLVNDFSRRKLLKNFSPVFLLVLSLGWITGIPIMWNFMILMGVITYFHPYLMDFDKEKARYLQLLIKEEMSLRQEISRNMIILERYLSSYPLDFTSYRKRYIKKRRYLESIIMNSKENDPCVPDFIRQRSIELEHIYFLGAYEKNEKIKALTKQLEFFKNRHRQIQKILEANKTPLN